MQNYRCLPLTFLAFVAFAGCSSVPDNNSVLNEARNDYSTAQNNPQVVNLAPNELKQAGDALAKANDAANKKDDAAVIAHLAYVAKQRSAIAQESAKQKQAETAVTDAAGERNQIRLDARTAEANKAQQNADASQRRAETSQRQADASQQQADASQQQAALSQQQSDMSQQQAQNAEMRSSQLEAQLKELNAKKTERGLVITLGDVLFDTNKAQLKSGATRSLEKLAGFLKQYPQRQAQVEGYTDNTGSADHNLELSDRRADAVRASLVSMGVSNERISTHGYGKDSPVASNDTAAGRQLNRRVEIILSDDNDHVSTAR